MLSLSGREKPVRMREQQCLQGSTGKGAEAAGGVLS
jgi:hypothetical protein